MSLRLPAAPVRAAVDRAGGALTLTPPGEGALRYGGLSAADSTGRALPARLELDGGRLLMRIQDRGAQYPVQVDPFVESARLTASNGAAFDLLGSSVAVSADGSTIVAGAPLHNAIRGAVYVFRRGSGGWNDGTEAAMLTASDAAAGDALGSSVAITADGSTVVSGAYLASIGSVSRQGAAYVFNRPQAGWSSGQESAKLTAVGPVTGKDNYFGYSVGISADGSIIAAGAPQVRFSTGTSKGMAWVFTEPNGGWSGFVPETAGLAASDKPDNSQLGISVAVGTGGFDIAAGAPFAKVGSNGSQGAVYVYSIQAIAGVVPDWSHGITSAKLTASDGALNDLLGNSIAVGSGGVVAASSNSAAAYVFQRTSFITGWTDAHEKAKLTASDGATGSDGGFVAVSGDDSAIAVGGLKPVHGVSGIYAFARPPSGWASEQEVATMVASGSSSAGFGSVAISGDGFTIVAGAPGATVGGLQRRGEVFVFPTATAGTLVCHPATVVVGQASTCTASLRSLLVTSPPTGTVTFSSDSAGTFAGNGRCTLTSTASSGLASCHTTYTPSKLGGGTHKVTAAYGGDASHARSQVKADVKITRAHTATSVRCNSAQVKVGRRSTCSVTVSDSGTSSGIPTGSVSFSSDSPGSFVSHTSCALAPTPQVNVASCVVGYTPSAVGSGHHRISARYAGDANHLPGSASGPLRVHAASSATTVNCRPLSVRVGHNTVCTATVTDKTSGSVTPAGSVVFKTSSKGTFSGHGGCTLKRTRIRGVSSCRIQYKPRAVGSGADTVTGRYRGGPAHSRSRGSTLVRVRP